MSRVSYCQAINQTLAREMERDSSVFLYGVGLGTRDQFFGSIAGLKNRFGPDRVIDTPIAENSMMGFGLGAAVNGLRPVMHHIRVDFLMLCMDQLVNMVAPYSYSTGGKVPVPLVIRAVVGRGWGQGWQHSKSLHSIFAHIPGLRVLLPTTPADAGGLLTAALRGNDPTLMIEHRWLYEVEDEVPDGDFVLPIDKPGEVLRLGGDLTIVATSWMAVEALHAARLLEQHHGVQPEVIDITCAAPLNMGLANRSIIKTGYGIVVDNDWGPCSLGTEIACALNENAFQAHHRHVARLSWDHSSCPTVRCLEDQFYPNAHGIVRTAERMLSLPKADLSQEEFYSHTKRFKGPF